jgi:hypothetical protein
MYKAYYTYKEKISTGVSPAELIFSYSILLLSHILVPIDNGVDSSDKVLIDARENQCQSDQHRLVENVAETTEYPINSYVLYKPPMGRGNK